MQNFCYVYSVFVPLFYVLYCYFHTHLTDAALRNHGLILVSFFVKHNYTYIAFIFFHKMLFEYLAYVALWHSCVYTNICVQVYFGCFWRSLFFCFFLFCFFVLYVRVCILNLKAICIDVLDEVTDWLFIINHVIYYSDGNQFQFPNVILGMYAGYFICFSKKYKKKKKIKIEKQPKKFQKNK